MIPPCLTLSNIKYVSRVKWINQGKGVAPCPTLRCSSYWKGSLRVTLDYGCQFYFTVSLTLYQCHCQSCVNEVEHNIELPLELHVLLLDWWLSKIYSHFHSSRLFFFPFDINFCSPFFTFLKIHYCCTFLFFFFILFFFFLSFILCNVFFFLYECIFCWYFAA